MRTWRRLSLLVVGAMVGLGLAAAPAGASGPVNVYDSIPSVLPGNVPSEAFEAQSVAEFGDIVGLGAGPRALTKVRVVMSSWGCEDGGWTGTSGLCSTTPGATFSHELTLNLYSVVAGQPGALLASEATTFAIPYRPSANTACPDPNNWMDGTGACFNGYATELEWDFSGMGISLPSQVVWTVAFNTTHYGAPPIGESAACYTESGGCGYDSLNVGTKTFVGSPFAGTDVDPDGAVLSSTWTGAYCDGGIGGTGTLRADTASGCWATYRPLAEIETTSTHIDGTGASNGVQTTAYKTSVRPPINADGTSVFNKRRGVIPVQFSLQAARGPFTLYSDTGNASADDDYGYASFTPTTPLTFGQLDTLKADYQFVDGDCYGGSLRWSVRVDSNLNGVSDPYDPYTNPGGDGAIFIYYGTYSSWDMCGGDINGPNQSGLNMIGMPDLRYDSTQLGGPWYGSYDQALAIAGGFNVWRASLGIDSGWVSRQEMTLGSATVNDRTFTPLPAQALAPTCDLPQAEIKVTKKDPNSGPEINETVDSVQNKDTGVYFRIVDCKYIYNLDVSTIDPNLSTRAGTYYVAAKIGGAVVGDRAQFDLR